MPQCIRSAAVYRARCWRPAESSGWSPRRRGSHMTSPRPFRINVPEAALQDLRDRLVRTRWPDPAPGGAWDQGADLGYMRRLAEYWRTQFDWRGCEARLN